MGEINLTHTHTHISYSVHSCMQLYLNEEVKDVLSTVCCGIHERRGAFLVASLGHARVFLDERRQPLLVPLLRRPQDGSYQRVHLFPCVGGGGEAPLSPLSHCYGRVAREEHEALVSLCVRKNKSGGFYYQFSIFHVEFRIIGDYSTFDPSSQGRCRERQTVAMETEADESATLLMESTHKKEPYLPLPVKQTLCFVQGSEKFEPDRSDEAVFSPPTAEKGATREKKKSFWKRVSGSPLCKVTVVVYLLGCVVVSALYVSLYGSSSQKMFAASDAWIPGKVSSIYFLRVVYTLL